MNTKQVTIAAVFGGAAFIVRFMNLVIPLVPPFVFDVRGLFVVVGAALAGPIAGAIVGFLAGLPASIPIIDVPAFTVAGFATGWAANKLYKHKTKAALSGLCMLFGYAVATVIVAIIGLWPAIMGLVARAVIAVPMNILILWILFKAYPPALWLARET